MAAHTLPTPTSPKPAEDVPLQPLGDPTVTHTEGGFGTIQREPKPEDYPPSAKITPPAEQLNSSLSQVIGAARLPEQVGELGDDLRAAADKAQDHQDEAIAKTNDAFEAKAEADAA